MTTGAQPEGRGVELCRKGLVGSHLDGVGAQAYGRFVNLTGEQERLWLLEQVVRPGINRGLLSISFTGDLDLQRLGKALNELRDRHLSLRLRLGSACGSVIAEVLEDTTVEIEPAADLGDALSNLLNNNQKQDDALRAVLAPGKKGEHSLLLSLNQILVSRAALPQLYRELIELYSGKVRAVSPVCTEAPAECDAAYWRRVLAGVSPLNLPADHSRPTAITCRASRVPLRIGAGASDVLCRGASALEVSATLIASVSTLLHKHTGQEDIAIGLSAISWDRAESAMAPVNPFVIRTEFSAEETFRDVQAKVQRNVLEAIQRGGGPIETLVADLKLGGDLTRNPFYQVGVEFLNEFPALDLPGLAVRAEETEEGTTDLDLTFVFRRAGSGFEGHITYNSDLFDMATVRRMAEHFGILLGAISANPNQAIGALPILSNSERKQLLEDWNRTEAAYEDKCVHELFEEQVLRTPETIALIFRDQIFTYRQLNERAERLAHHLRRGGIGANALVGVCLDRSPAMLLSQLAILKAGGAYVPLDPAYPRERLAFMAADAQLALLITEKERAAEFDLPQHRVLYVDAFDWDSPIEEAKPCGNVSPEDLAYVIYTSGSTGKPKGVMITHRNVGNFFTGMDEVIGREPGVWLAVTSICFDISVLELLWTLSRGFKVILQPDKSAVESRAESIPAQIQRHRITHFQCTPSLAAILMQEPGGLEALRTVRKVLLGGEPLPSWMADKLSDAVELINVYGPTETTVWSTACRVRAGEAITIGRPIANTHLYILDTNLQPAPIGVPGEIYIGGLGVARGYLNRPELTAERFIANPFGRERSGRIYRTGDLGRWLPDGRVECLGRADFQVKIRGFRIEPGEIESALREHPGVQESVATTREYGAGDTRLVAYYVPKNGAAVEPADLRDFLRERVPDYMVPSAIVTLRALPLTPNGKVDRKALPAPDVVQDRPCAPLRNAHEKALARIWEEVLAATNIDAADNFFALGGTLHSALKVQHLAWERFAAKVTLLDLVQNPVLSAQARVVGQAHEVTESAIQWLPLTEGQKDVWLISQKSDEASCLFNISEVLHFKGPLNTELLGTCIEKIIDRHCSLRVTFKSDGTGQRILPRVATTLVTEDWSGLTPEDRESRLDEALRSESETPFDLVTGPLFRWRVMRLTDREYVLVFTVNHIVADRSAVDDMLRELGALYSGAAVSDTESFQEFVRAASASPASEEFWLAQYMTAPAPTELPVDRPRPSAPSFKGAWQKHELPGDLANQLKALSQSRGVSTHAMLLAAYGALIRKLTLQEENIIGVRVQSPHDVIADRINFLPIRMQCPDEDTFATHATNTEKLYRQATTHADCSLGTLVRRLTELNELGRIPAVSVGLAIREAKEQPRFDGIEVAVKRNPHVQTNLDLDTEILMRADSWEIHCTFNREVLDGSTVQRWMKHFQTLLENTARQPDAAVGDLSLLTPAERRQIVEEWNATDLSYPQELCLQERFEEQAARTPQAVALVCGERTTTYGELNARANQLARVLIKNGARADTLIGVWLDRSEELVIALLAVLKSGAAYLPLDAGYPRERLQYMLEDTAARLLITQSHWLPHLPSHSAKTICMDTAQEIASESPTQPDGVVHSARNLAYVIYTSGSTGKPKGVAIEHASATAFVHWAREVFTAEEFAGTLASTSVCFDLSIFEVFAPLSWGGTVILAENIMQLPDLPARDRVTLVNTVPSAAGDLLRAKGVPPSVTTFALAGEPLTTRLVDDLYALPHVAKVYDLYGPSETTTYSTFGLRHAGRRATVGKPLANTQIYIVDRRFQPTPIGVLGEICIGGAGLARGYLNAPEATAQKFVPDPFRAGSRLYRTGDLGRWLPNAEIEFLGRRDHQVKIRGYRIELGEVESVMSAHPAVREAAAIVRDEKVLAGYAAIDPDSALTVNEFRHYLRQKLPDYMVPTSVMFLDAMPRTPSGKVDRKALPAPMAEGTESTAAATGELNPIEDTLVQIWRDVIGVQRVGVQDNFFDLGGHSVLAVQALARIRTAFQVDLTLRNVFEAPTLAEMARVIEERLIAELEALPEEEQRVLEEV